MEIKSYKKLRDNRYKINTTDEEIILYDDIILKYNLLLTKKINDQELTEIKKENKSLECFYQAIKYLASKNRCKKEIREYLKKYSYKEEDINKAIKQLEEKKYINEDVYLSSFINDQIHLTTNGPKKIEKKLLELDFSKEQILDKLTQIDSSIWRTRLEKIIDKRIFSNRKDSAKKCQEKIIMYCMNEGYKKEDIISILNKKEIDDDFSILEKEANKLYHKLIRKYEGNALYYQLKGKLFQKGYKSGDIDKIIESIKKTSI